MSQKSDTQLLIEAVKNADLFRLLVERMPQGDSSGLDADMVDGYHASDLIRRCQEVLVESNKLIHGVVSPTFIHNLASMYHPDVSIATPVDGQMLVYDGPSSTWKIMDPNVTVVGDTIGLAKETAVLSGIADPATTKKVNELNMILNADGTVASIVYRDVTPATLFTLTFSYPDATHINIVRS